LGFSNFDCSVTNSEQTRERSILNEFFQSTKGIDWLLSTDWDSAAAHCSWWGIECNSRGFVAQMDLASNNLDGLIPTSLFGLKYLRRLDLSRNSIAGTIPEEIGGLKRLQLLDISHTQISGEIPTSLFSLPSLDKLSISDTLLTQSDASSLQVLSERIDVECSDTCIDSTACSIRKEGCISLEQSGSLSLVELNASALLGL